MKDSEFNHMGIKRYNSLINKIKNYCMEYQAECENSGKGTLYRSYREVAQRYCLTYEQLFDIIQDSEGKLETVAGYQVGGLGGGVWEPKFQGDQQVEYVR